jgi:hypothetical protein
MLKLEVVWFDSLGAKSSCSLITTKAVSILLDPGAAIMQPSYPLARTEKLRLLRRAVKKIEEASRRADIIAITHYHHDHYLKPYGKINIYEGKKLLIKDPNRWINLSQHGRAREFLKLLFGTRFDEILVEPEEKEYPDPVEKLDKALSKDYGPYSGRKAELLEKGRRWFMGLTKLWGKESWIKDKFLNFEFADGKRFEFGSTTIEISQPMFHGIEYDRTGWVIAVTVKEGKDTLLYSSDLMGPQIEDYADYIIKVRPKTIILDGPPIYLFPYMLNRINLNRAIENVIGIIRDSGSELIIYDHHLMRKKSYERYMGKVYREAEKAGVKLLAASQILGVKPLIDLL